MRADEQRNTTFSHSAALTGVEMAFRYRHTAWMRGPEDLTGIVLCGVDEGRPFAIVVHSELGNPSKQLLTALVDWRRAGASTGLCGTVKEALMIVEGAGSRAS